MLEKEMPELSNRPPDPFDERHANELRDVNEQLTLARETADDSTQRYRDLVEGLDAIVWEAEADADTWRFTFVSQRAQSMLGYPVDRWLQEPTFWIGLIHPEDREQVVSMCKATTVARKEVRIEYRANASDGRMVWVALSARARVRVSGTAQLHGLMVDITEGKCAQHALEESQARYRAIVEGQTELICRFRPDTVLTFVNDGYCRYFHKTPKEVLGQSALWILPENQHEGARAHIASLQTHLRVSGCEHEVMSTDGERRWLEWTDRAIMDDGGSVTEIEAIGRDITDRKQAELTLRRLSGRLLQLQDEERRRIARELHDSTAQSLAALSMNLTVIETEAERLSDEARKALGEAVALARHTTRELRTLSYLLHPPLLDESGLISAVRWYVDGISQRSGLRVALDLPAHPCRFPSEVETALFRIMQECLTNILKHSGSATATIRVALDESLVIMDIRDQGKGMSISVPGKEGDPVSRLGVGIMGMRERVRQLHGRLDLDSGSWGTAVTVSLPLDGGEQWTHFAS